MKNTNRRYVIGSGLLAASLLFAGCSAQYPSVEAGQTSGQKAEQAVSFAATKNTTRIQGEDAEDLSISTAQMIWPATKAGTKPNVVLLAPKESWQAQLVALDLVHHPSDGPLLVTEKGKVSQEVMDELMRLHPQGASDGTQVIAIGMDASVAEELSGHFKVKEIRGEKPEELAAAIDQYYAEASGSLPASVVVSTSEAPEYAVPAGNWISHMPEPLLYVTKGSVPQATADSLKKRNGKATIYLLGPESVIDRSVEKELQSYGKVVRIAGNDPVANAIAFAAYKDPQTGFGWGITTAGHGLVLADAKNVKEAIPVASFAHRGKHAPLLLTEREQAPKPLVDYLTTLKPLYKEEPTEGPYNHLYIVGDQTRVSAEQQGDLDHLIEIEAQNGQGHGGHSSGGDQGSQGAHPADHGTPAPLDNGSTDHSGH
ncbi:cell wall-binding repeat-containing protein [Brevibacillus migulae]|uniref:cell wall-binding repeat-containing protein n=1 Tax=Brevibacillus migulae TaxID=1644114 RepID=UPI00106F0120|nr:cell wall-binding repeat-containing protein [Brevibacillus migulae]